MKKVIGLDELKKIQMDILEVVDKFCLDNNIHYSLACGSLLGAIRHKGYIPWDDDIDIYIPRKEYERFVRIFPKELDHISLISMERDSQWNRAYAQAFDNRTVMNEYAKTPVKVGVYIDVYPVDSVPNSDKEWLRYNKVRRLLIRIYELKYIPFRRKRVLRKSVILLLGKILLLPISSRILAIIINRYAQIYNGKGCSRSFECVQGMLQKRPFKSSLMTDLSRVPFEDRHFMVMTDFDAYLSNGYGNYMQLPPKEKQKSHHQFEAYWKE